MLGGDRSGLGLLERDFGVLAIRIRPAQRPRPLELIPQLATRLALLLEPAPPPVSQMVVFGPVLEPTHSLERIREPPGVIRTQTQVALSTLLERPIAAA